MLEDARGRELHGVVDRIGVREVVHFHRRRAEVLLEGAVVVPVGPEGDVLLRAGGAESAAVAGVFLDSDDRAERVARRIESHAGQLLVIDVGLRLRDDPGNGIDVDLELIEGRDLLADGNLRCR